MTLRDVPLKTGSLAFRGAWRNGWLAARRNEGRYCPYVAGSNSWTKIYRKYWLQGYFAGQNANKAR